MGVLVLAGCADKSVGDGASSASPAASGMAKSTPPAATAEHRLDQGTTIEPMPTSAPPKPIARQDKSGGDGDTRKGGEKLRDEAETELGDRFTYPAFHDVVLGGGAVPLPVLEARVKRWIAATRGEAAPK